jgi:hypothetical protein
MPAVLGTAAQPAPIRSAVTIVLTALAVAIAALSMAAPVKRAGIASTRGFSAREIDVVVSAWLVMERR